MLIKINKHKYISKYVIHQICIAVDNDKHVIIYGDGFMLRTSAKTNKDATLYLENIVRIIGNNENDLSMYDWKVFV